MRNSAFAIIIGTMMLPATAQLAETRGQRLEVVYGEAKHYVTLTFHVSQTVFFLQPGFAENNPSLATNVKQRGYTVLPWNNTAQYDKNYVPTAFGGILLSDRDVLGRTSKMADVMAFYNLALYSGNASTVAF